jgi:hypothetical protein
MNDREVWVRFPAGARNSPFRHRVHIESETHPAYAVVIGPAFLGGKAAGA